MKCLQCNFENQEDANFCKKCGTKLKLVCPSCSRPYHQDSLFCDECGYDLRKPEHLPPTGYSEPRSYTPKFLAEKILTTRSSIEGERKIVTVLFADVANYTAISEKLDPEEVHDIMDGCFTILMDDIHQYEGTINQFTGDGIMGLFGAPIAHEDHAVRALHAALEIQSAIGKYGGEVEHRWGIPFKLRLGLNTGLVVVGRIGDNLRMDYTASGDTTNLAARLQQMAPAGAIWVGEATYRLAESAFEWQATGPMEMKGKAEPVPAYELIGRRTVKSRFEVLAQRGLTRFAGRKSELSRLQKLFTKADKGQGQAVGIQGEAGVGKSRLLYEFRQNLDPNVLYLEGQCVPYGLASAYQPLISVLRQHWSLPEQISEQVSEKIAQQLNGLKEYLSCFEDLLSLPSSNPNYVHLSPQMRRMKTFAALIGLFQQAAADHPLVLAIEDLQWIDQTSQEFIATLLDALATSRILLVLLSRPEFQPPWQEHAQYTYLSLPLLPESEGQRLVQALFDAPVAPEVEEYILGHTEGNPFFAEELTRTLHETKALKRNDQYSLVAPSGELRIPETVQGVLGARIDRMDNETKYTLQVASVIGREFAVPILRQVLGGNGKLQAQLGLLSEKEFVYPQKPLDSTYVFKHALTRDVAYETLLRRIRRRLHQQVADSIKELLPEITTAQPEILAHHYTEAELPNQAIPYWQQAGQKAIQASANVEAISHLSKGLELLKTLPDTPARAQQELVLHTTLGAALLATKGFAAPEVGNTFGRARELGQQVGEITMLFPSLRNLYMFYLGQGDMRTMQQIGEQLLTLSRGSRDSSLSLEAHHVLGIALFHQGRFVFAKEHFDKAMVLYDPKQHSSHAYLYGYDPGVSCMSYSSMALCHFGYPDQALKKMQECIALAQEIDHKLSITYAQAVNAMIHQYRREATATQEWAEKAMALSEEYGFPHWLAWTNVLRGWALVMQGQSEKGIPQIRQGLEIHRNIGSRLSLPTELGHLAEACLSGDQTEEGLTAVEEALGEVHTRGEAWWSAELHRLKANLLLSLSNKNQAEAASCFREAVAVAKEQNTKYFELHATTSLARLLQNQGSIAEAKKMLSEIYNWFTEGFDTTPLKEARALLEELS